MNKKLRKIRKSMKKTQQEMADLLGVGKRTYTRYEREGKPIPSDCLEKIAKYGYNVNWLLTGQGEMLKSETKKAPDETAGGLVSEPDHDYNREEKARRNLLDIIEEYKKEKKDLERLKFEIEQSKKEKAVLDSQYRDILERLEELDQEDRELIYQFITKLATK